MFGRLIIIALIALSWAFSGCARADEEAPDTLVQCIERGPWRVFATDGADFAIVPAEFDCLEDLSTAPDIYAA